ncbi:MAG: DUF5683 domain-containing protein [Mucinivorans sp.]
MVLLFLSVTMAVCGQTVHRTAEPGARSVVRTDAHGSKPQKVKPKSKKELDKEQSMQRKTQPARIVVRGGRRLSPLLLDTLSGGLNSLQRDSLAHIDSLLGRDTLARGQFAIKAKADSLSADSLALTRAKRHFSLTRDTISAGGLVALSLIPGMGQIYNRQWWKAPVFYAVMGGFAAGGFALNNQARLASNRWQRALDAGAPLDVTNPIKNEMKNNKTAATVMFALAGATYLYQLADATFNYRGKINHTRKATVLAALFPGAGFIYTRTYWRLPIYYGGFAVVGTVIDYNNRSYQRYKRAYEIVSDGDPTTVDEFNGRYSADILKNAKDSYRRNRDLGIIGMAGIYLLSVIDTYVIAMLKNWDITPELSVTVAPKVFDERLGETSLSPSGAGLALRVKF